MNDICANNTNLFADCGKIIKFSKDLEVLEEYEHAYTQSPSMEKTFLPVCLTCNDETFFAIPKKIYAALPEKINEEEKYYLLKKYMYDIAGEKVAKDNELIHSCAYNKDKKILYICMYNVIWIIEDKIDGLNWNYIYFKNKPITEAYYDNDINKLIVGFSETSNNHLHGRIVEYSDEELKKMMVPIKDEYTNQNNNLLEEENTSEIKKLK